MRLHYNRRKLLTPGFRKPSALAAARVDPDFTTGQDGLPKVAMEPESNWRKLLTWARLKKGLALSATAAVPVVALTAPTVQMEQKQQAPGQDLR
jgi:hypothetical protein